MSKAKKFLVVIPAYNEEESIALIIDETKKFLPLADILVVNDGSTDATARIAEEKGIFVINLLDNLGIGVAVQTGYMFARVMGYDITLRIDADGQHNPKEATNIIKPVWEGRADMAIGSRYIEERGYKTPFARRTGTQFFSYLISLILRQEIKDPSSGFRAVNRKVIDFFVQEYSSDYPEVEELVYLHRAGYTICEVPTSMRERRTGRSSITSLRAIYYMIKVSLAILIDLFRKRR